MYNSIDAVSEISDSRKTYVRPDSSSDDRRAFSREEENASRRRAHMRPENSVEERQFISLALAASIHDAKEQGRDGLVNFDPSCPPPGASNGVPRISLPSPFSPSSYGNASHGAPGASNMVRQISSFSGMSICVRLRVVSQQTIRDASVTSELQTYSNMVAVAASALFRTSCDRLGREGDTFHRPS